VINIHKNSRNGNGDYSDNQCNNRNNQNDYGYNKDGDNQDRGDMRRNQYDYSRDNQRGFKDHSYRSWVEVQIGSNYMKGMYIIEVLLGLERKVLKVVKR
jgi:hypothetical protein